MFAAGLLVGTTLGLALSHFARGKPSTYVLKQDFDLSKAFFFEGRPAPVQGTIAAGSKFDVELRYSSADYIAFRTVIDRDTLMRMSVPARADPMTRR
jgi:hypothetical protein